MTYGVVWSESREPVNAGSLELGDTSLLLAGTSNGSRDSRRELAFDELVDAWIERGSSARLGGRPTLVLQLRGACFVRIASVEGRGALHELADRLADARRQTAA
jgi:hypothetical protein